jgi:regulatory protein
MAQARDGVAARERCVRLLSLRARSAAELRERLERADFAQDTIAEVLGDLKRVGLVDDEDFARSLIASRQASGGVGRRKLRWELRRKGIDEELIRRMIDELTDEETEMQQALHLVERRTEGQSLAPTDVPRLRRLLLGRGFGHGIVESVLQRLTKDLED